MSFVASGRYLLHTSSRLVRKHSSLFESQFSASKFYMCGLPRSRGPAGFVPREFRRGLYNNSVGEKRSVTAAMNTSRDDEVERVRNGSNKHFLTIPTMLTVARVAAVPVLIAVYFSNQSWSPICSTGIFVAACLTDWLDGYLARKMKLDSAFGAFLDPVADKLMVATALVLLCSRPLAAPLFADVQWLIPLPAALMISREIIISAIREWAALQGGELHKAVAVDKLGKLKTATQMISLTLLLAFCDARTGVEVYLSGLGVGVLYASTGLSLWSLSGYMRRLWHNIQLREKRKIKTHL